MDDPEIAILLSDLHFSQTPPRLRQVEPDWLKTQASYLRQVYDCIPMEGLPVVIAGDSVHQPSGTPLFVNWLLDHFPEAYVVLGQHDVHNHRLDSIHRTVMGILQKVRRVILLQKDQPLVLRQHGLVLHGFNWGEDVTPCNRTHWPTDYTHLAVVHAMIWTKGTGHVGAKEESRLKNWGCKIKGYHTCLFGDNHSQFLIEREDQTIYNHGCFMIRRKDEVYQKPSIGILHRSGKVSRKYLDISKDLYCEDVLLAETKRSEEMEDVVEALNEKDEVTPDFHDSILRRLDDKSIRDGVREVVLKCVTKEEKS